MNGREGWSQLAWVSPEAIVGHDVEIGPFSVIQPGAILADQVRIGAHAVVEQGARLAEGVRLDHRAIVRAGTAVGARTAVGVGAVVGQAPSRARTSTLEAASELPPLTVGEDCQIGAGAIVYAGSVLGGGCFIADSAQVRERCHLGANVIVGHNATIENDCVVGDGTKIQTGAYLTAHSQLGECVFIAPMVTTSNDNYVGRTTERFKHRKGLIVEKGGRVGANAVTLPGVTVGQEALVGAGSLVSHDVPAFKVAFGVPARVVREVPAEQIVFPQQPEVGKK